MRRFVLSDAFSAMLILGMLYGCPRTPPGPGPADVVVVERDAAHAADGGDAFACACSRLADLGCPEGRDATLCRDTMRHAQESGLTDLAPACVASAGTVATLRQCSRAWATGCKGR